MTRLVNFSQTSEFREAKASESGGGVVFAVGTSITGRPPHRSERAQFGHSAPTLGVSDGRAHTYHAALRTRSNACDTLSRSCARHVLCWPAFPSVPVLGSAGSAADRSALFVGFVATTTESDFSGSYIIGFDSSSSRCGPAESARRSNPRPPGSRAKSFHTCQGLRPRRTGRALALSRSPCCLP